jgi:hypothetical protein
MVESLTRGQRLGVRETSFLLRRNLLVKREEKAQDHWTELRG